MKGMKWSITIRGGFENGAHPGDALEDLADALLDCVTVRSHEDDLGMEPFYDRVQEDNRYQAMIQVSKQPPTGDLLIYLAGPISTDPTDETKYATKAQERANIRRAIDVADAFAMRGHSVFVPHLNRFWHIRHPRGFEFWMRQDENILRRCDLMVRMPGASRGADREQRYAEQNGVQVVVLKESALPLRDDMIAFITDAVMLNQFGQARDAGGDDGDC